MTSALAVWLSDRRVGTLEKTASGDLLYTPGVDVPLTVAVSGVATWSAQLTRNWFDGLLPEGDRRTRLAARFGLRSEDTFGLLAEIGWECAGAVAVLPEDRSPAGRGPVRRPGVGPAGARRPASPARGERAGGLRAGRPEAGDRSSGRTA